MATLTSIHPTKQITHPKTKQNKPTTIDLVGGILCNICHSNFATKKDYDTHYYTHGNFTDIIYTCNICLKEITGYPSFRGHCYTKHVIKGRFKCETCTKEFAKFSTLKEHIEIVHKFKCPTCSKEFTSTKELQLHQIIHNDSDQPPYDCRACKSQIESVDECKEHIDMHIKNLYHCPICNENIPDKETALDHLKPHFGDEYEEEFEKEIPKSSEETFIEEIGGIFCEICSAVLKNRVEFDAHFSCEHGDEDIVYMCVVCGNTFEKYSVFYNHCYNHSMKNRYECQICQKSFPRLSLLATHSAVCQQGGATDSKPYACTMCEARFGCENRWRKHLSNTHGLRAVPCPRRGCNEVFETPKQLILHQQTHDIKIRHYCNQCRVVLPNSAAAEFHMDLHKKNVYYCPVCPRTYREKYILMNHVSQHFETVLHLCKVCSKVCSSRRRFLDHMKTHSIVKNFACNQCDKSFTKQQLLEQHLNTHTGSKPHICPVCQRAFASAPNWRKHIRRMHDVDSNFFKNSHTNHTEGVEDETNAMALDEEDAVSTDNTNTYVDDPFSNTDEQVSSVDEQTYNAGAVTNVTSYSDEADCLDDIDDANASIDFANVKLENYIFSVNNDVVDIPSIPDVSDLLSENSGSPSIEEQLFNESDIDKAIVENLFNESNEQSNLVENFDANLEENTSVEEELFAANVEETPDPEDILEYIAEMPENNSLFVPVIPQEPLPASVVQQQQQQQTNSNYPCEYGPEFNDLGASGFVDLDDHMMPHIDPHLTVNEVPYAYVQSQHYGDYNVTVQATDYDNAPKWEPPIITKLYDEYAYGYDMAEPGRMSIMNTDIF